MTEDDILAMIAKNRRPTELKSDVVMLAVWLKMRTDREFTEDVMLRHGLTRIVPMQFDMLNNPVHKHAYGNAVGHCVREAVIMKKGGRRMTFYSHELSTEQQERSRSMSKGKDKGKGNGGRVNTPGK